MENWKTLSRHIAFEAPPYLRVVREAVEVAPGTVLDDFWQVELRNFVAVVPMLPDGRVITMTGYRHGPRRVCLSLPGGFIDPGESPETAARRELAEETGLSAAKLVFLGNYVDNGNQRGANGHYFLALGCTPSGGMVDDVTEAASRRAQTVAEVDSALFQGAFAVIHHAAGWAMARLHPEFPRP